MLYDRVSRGVKLPAPGSRSDYCHRGLHIQWIPAAGRERWAVQKNSRMQAISFGGAVISSEDVREALCNVGCDMYYNARRHGGFAIERAV